MFHTGPTENLIIRILRETQVKGVKSLLLEGLPGTGKTAFAGHLANIFEAKYNYVLCHNWITDEEMFLAPNLGAIVTETVTPETVWSDGFLSRVAKQTLEGMVVACIDEIDKAPERMEVLLLDFLQNGRVHNSSGTLIVEANLANLIVVLTSNKQRELMDATKRRCIKHEMQYLPSDVESMLLRSVTGAPIGLTKIVVSQINKKRERGHAISLQEMVNYLNAAKLCKSAAECEMIEKLFFGRTVDIANRINGILAASRKSAVPSGAKPSKQL